MADGVQPDRIIMDEMGSDEPRREMIIVRADGTTYSADVPASLDIGDVLDNGDVVGFDGGGQR